MTPADIDLTKLRTSSNSRSGSVLLLLLLLQRLLTYDVSPIACQMAASLIWHGPQSQPAPPRRSLATVLFEFQ